MIKKWLRKNISIILLALFALGVFVVTIRINIFRFNNFDFGKFDLGNMTQMVWYTLQGKPLYLTDYFGTNLPRWSMSHVDPILLIFVPIFAVFQHSLTLVFSQVFLILFGALIIFKITELELKSKFLGLLFGLAYLFYPAIGFLNAWTGFHGVTAAVPFFLAAFYVYERMYRDENFSTKRLILFWIFLIITMMGKEQLPLYVALYGLFISIFRFKEPLKLPKPNAFKKWILNLAVYKNIQIGLSMMLVGFIWFIVAFFVIIPAFAHQRIEGYEIFAKTIELNTAVARDVASENYFISRYEAFGDTYTEVAIGMLTHPSELARVAFGGDKPENLKRTLEPLGYTSLLYPPLFMLALPDFLINYGTSAGGIGTSEIINHRISMIIPVLFLSSIFGVSWLSSMLHMLLNRKVKVDKIIISSTLVLIVLGFNILTSFSYENPVYLWLTQAVKKRVTVLAKEDTEVNLKHDLMIGDRFKLSALDNKDRECALKVVSIVPDNASVSGPDYLGAHLAMRETYAIFPALYKEADYVIVDVFSQKILRILDLDVSLVRDVVADVLKNPDYKLKLGCGNLFVFENIGHHNKTQLLPLQEKFVYTETTNLEIFQSLTVVDYEFPEEIKRGDLARARLTYVKREEERLDDYVLFLSFINSKTGEMYQVANLPSFALNQLGNWDEDRYYIENLDIALPEFLDAGEYKIFIGMSNNIRTRSIYLGDLKVL